MFRLIKAEAYVLFKTKAFRVLCVIALLIAFMTIGISKLMSSEDFIKSSLKGMTTQQQEQFMKSLQSKDSDPIVSSGSGMGIHIQAKDIFHPTGKEIFHSAFGSGVMEILLSVLVGAMVAKEYSSGTIKNILAYGKKREQYYIAKLLACTIGFAVMLAIILFVTAIEVCAIFGWGSSFNVQEALGIVEIFLAATVLGMAIIALLMLVATLFKSNGATIGIGIVGFTILPTVFSFLYGKYSWFDKLYESTTSYNWALATSVRAADNDVLKASIVGIITLIIASSAGIFIFKKQDIK
ncbi:ABC transporter permease subunit [Clostridium sp. 19966]|uniref:ABC transporter permease subunit n=1 Tax=Clostridium sp. 19966 TaxID=2768166 RepID=UPI0028DEAF1A|nr:ABC transporter permease subunit [Clostridium sp. 19966]MDT8716915.1 ABC transporter permease subunit [Clostridium sp. 19966]